MAPDYRGGNFCDSLRRVPYRIASCVHPSVIMEDFSSLVLSSSNVKNTRYMDGQAQEEAIIYLGDFWCIPARVFGSPIMGSILFTRNYREFTINSSNKTYFTTDLEASRLNIELRGGIARRLGDSVLTDHASTTFICMSSVCLRILTTYDTCAVTWAHDGLNISHRYCVERIQAWVESEWVVITTQTRGARHVSTES